MEPLGGAPAAQGILDQIQDALPPDVRQDARADRGAPLLFVLACRLRDLDVAGDLDPIEAVLTRNEVGHVHWHSGSD